MTVARYTIPVRGGATVHLAVDITVHGPIMTQAGQTMAVDWMGNVPSDDLGALMGINRASDWAQFKAALSTWRAPTQNFTYADNDPVSPGSAAGYAYESLDAAVGSGQVSAATIASLQNSVTDSLAASIVPRLLAVLRSAGPLPPAERSAASVLGSWDYSMSADSAAATVWWTFWSDYVG